MLPKKQVTELDALNSRNVGLSGRRPEIPEDVASQLLSVGSRVRRQVSEGYATQPLRQRNLSLENPNIVGPLTREGIQQQFNIDQIRAGRALSADALPRRSSAFNSFSTGDLKRRRDRDDDRYTPMNENGDDTDADDDTDDDMDQTSVGHIDNQHRAVFPIKMASHSRYTDDFGDCEFLKPRENFD